MNWLTFKSGDNMSAILPNNTNNPNPTDNRFTIIEKRLDAHEKMFQQINNKLEQILSNNNNRRSRSPSQF